MGFSTCECAQQHFARQIYRQIDRQIDRQISEQSCIQQISFSVICAKHNMVVWGGHCWQPEVFSEMTIFRIQFAEKIQLRQIFVLLKKGHIFDQTDFESMGSTDYLDQVSDLFQGQTKSLLIEGAPWYSGYRAISCQKQQEWCGM